MKFIFFFLPVLLAIAPLRSDEEPRFNFGVVALENSGSPQAQAPFLQGLAAMHSFEYREALLDFKKAQEIDPNFALAYWGEAMSHNQAFWRQQDFDAARIVMEKLGKTPEERVNRASLPLEKDLIHSLEILYGPGTKIERDKNYHTYMEELYAKYPNNLEILSLYALSILGTIQPNETSFRKYMKVAGVIDGALGYHPSQEQLNHPGILHYYIHSLDDPIHASLALKAAERYANVAPDAPHALHMPSHIYIQLGMWGPARQANQVSYEASKKWVDLRTQNLAHREYHSLYWLMYANLQMGKYKEARENLNHILDLMEKDQACEIEGHWALMTARYMVETKECNLPFSLGEVEKMQDCYVSDEPQLFSYLYYMGFCSLMNKDFSTADQVVRMLEKMRDELLDSKNDLDLSNQEIDFRTNLLTISIEQLLAIRDKINGNLLGALDRLSKAANIEVHMSLPNGIPVQVQSALELYGNFLLEDKQWERARLVFLDALDRVPNRAKTHLGIARAWEGLGNPEEANKYAQKALKVWENADEALPELNEARRLSK